MLYIGIDQHRKQLTVSMRDESRNVVLRRQVGERDSHRRSGVSG
jgi:hypothetical protein